MPTFKNTAPVVPVIPSPPPTPSPPINTASVYSTLSNTEKVFTYIDGVPWPNTFYTQWMDNTDVVGNSGDILDPTLKQYTKINNYEIRVTQPLSPSTDTQLGTSTVSGVSNTYPGVVPMLGDIFIGMIEDGSVGVFEITNVEKGSHFRGTACTITYQLKEYLTDTTFAHYDSFVINELYFDVTKLDSGSNPLFTKSEYDRIDNIDAIISDLVEGYIEAYYSVNLETFLVPQHNSTKKVYDPFLVEFWNKYIHDTTVYGIKKPLAYSISNGLHDRSFSTVLDAIGEQNDKILARCIPVMKNVATMLFDAPMQRNSIRLSSISEVVYLDLLTANPVREKSIDNMYYVLGEKFYANDMLFQTPLERLISKMIHRQAVSFTDVILIYNNLSALTYEDKFYYIPLLIILFKVCR